MKYLRWSLWIIIGIVIVVFIGAYGWLRATLPSYKGELTVTGITGNVTIIRDSFGMPHIYADNDADAYFALGYCMAQDRLFQMDMLRRAIRGRLSEILGKDMVGVDKLFRTITAVKPVDDLYADYPPEIVDGMTAFAAGVNYYLDTRTGPLPVEFTLLGYEPEPWKPSDCGAVYYYMAWDLNSSFDVEPLFDLIKQEGGRRRGPRALRRLPHRVPDDHVGNRGGVVGQHRADACRHEPRAGGPRDRGGRRQQQLGDLGKEIRDRKTDTRHRYAPRPRAPGHLV